MLKEAERIKAIFNNVPLATRRLILLLFPRQYLPTEAQGMTDHRMGEFIVRGKDLNPLIQR